MKGERLDAPVARFSFFQPLTGAYILFASQAETNV
jgi:hypothetical protein